MLRLLTHPYLLLALTMLFWSSNAVVGRAVADQVPPMLMTFGRWSAAALLVVPIAWPHLRGEWAALRAGWRPIAVLALLGIAGFNALNYLGLQYTTATNGALLNSFVPVATIALSWLLLGQRLRGMEWVGVAVSLAGVLTIIAQGSLTVLLGMTPNVGDLWIFLAVLDWALYSVALAWKPERVHPMSLLAAMIVLGLVMLVPLVAWEYAQGHRMHLDAGSLAAIVYTGVFPGVLGYVFFNRGVAAIGPNKASLFLHLMPVFGTLLAALLLGEVPRWYHGVGIALIFCGIVLTMRRAAAGESTS